MLIHLIKTGNHVIERTIEVLKTHLFGAGEAGANKVCFPDLSKNMFLGKSKMKPVVKYGVYKLVLGYIA